MLSKWILIIPLVLLLLGVMVSIENKKQLLSFIAFIIAVLLVHYFYTMYNISSVSLSSIGKSLIVIFAIIIYYVLHKLFK